MVSLPVTANSTEGSYEVYADAGGNTGDYLTYTLTNQLIRYLLTVNLAGDGSGTVTGSGINCFDGAGADCTQNYVEGTEVTLVAAADSGSSFTVWSGGGCSGTGNCVVTMSQTRSVTATFTSEEKLIFLPLAIR